MLPLTRVRHGRPWPHHCVECPPVTFPAIVFRRLSSLFRTCRSPLALAFIDDVRSMPRMLRRTGPPKHSGYDALRAHGILPPKPEAPRTPSPPPPPTLDELDLTQDELRELAEDAPDDDEGRVLESYRRARLAEMQREVRRARFGRVYPIGRDDYQREVTDASKEDEEGEERVGHGTGVVCFLYKDGSVENLWYFLT